MTALDPARVRSFDVGALFQDGRYQQGDFAAEILAVCVEIHDDVCAQVQAGVNAILERLRQPEIAPMARDHVCARCLCHLRSAIRRAIIHHHDLSGNAQACQMAEQPVQPGRVIADGNDNRQFHAVNRRRS